MEISRSTLLTDAAVKFREVYAYDPCYLSVAPGRVSIIGEHIDYNGFPVFPMSIDQYMVCSFGIRPYTLPGESILTVSSADCEKFPTLKIEDFGDLRVCKAHTWSNYVMAGVIGLAEYLLNGGSLESVGTSHSFNGAHASPMNDSTSFLKSIWPGRVNMLVSGNILGAAGLSSSSALVVASTAGFLKMFKVRLTRSILGRICASSERYVGTQGGGMDQAVICLSKPNFASLISFDPLSCTHISLPKGVTFVVADSMERWEKAVMADSTFNKRVVECRLAFYILFREMQSSLGLDLSDLRQINISKAMDVYLEKFSTKESGRLTKKDLLPLINQKLKPVLHRDEIEELIPPETLHKLFEDPALERVWNSNGEYHLRCRLEHVVEESIRVDRFVQICSSCTDPSYSDFRDRMTALGEILNESQNSLSSSYECSSPRLNELTCHANQLGALGAKLTGAGWGGCAIFLVESRNVEKFLEELKNFVSYYVIAGKNGVNLSEHIFIVKSGGSVSVYETERDVSSNFNLLNSFTECSLFNEINEH